MTTPPDAQENEKYTDIGINDTIPKPVDPRNLLDVIEKWITEPKGAEPQDAMVFDKKGLMERVLDDEDLVRELIDEFLIEIPQRLEELAKSLESGDSNQIRYQGHTIKGTSGNMGAISLQKVAARIEAAGQADDIETATSLTEQLRQQFDIFVAETSKYSTKLSIPKEPI